MTSGSQPSAHATTGYGPRSTARSSRLRTLLPQIAVASLDIGGVSYETNDLQTSRVKFLNDVYPVGRDAVCCRQTAR